MHSPFVQVNRHGNDRRAEPARECERSACGARGAAEELRVNARSLGVLIQQNADDRAATERARWAEKTVFARMDDESGTPPPFIQETIRARIEDRARHHMDLVPARHERSAENFPIPEMRGNRQHSATHGDGLMQMFFPFESDDLFETRGTEIR